MCCCVTVVQQYIAPVMSLFGPINIPMNAYNNCRVYGTILCFLMFVCVFIGVKFVSKFSPIALFCVVLSILCVYIGIFVANPSRGPESVFVIVPEINLVAIFLHGTNVSREFLDVLV